MCPKLNLSSAQKSEVTSSYLDLFAKQLSIRQPLSRFFNSTLPIIDDWSIKQKNGKLLLIAPEKL
jgi:hypothetical protein